MLSTLRAHGVRKLRQNLSKMKRGCSSSGNASRGHKASEQNASVSSDACKADMKNGKGEVGTQHEPQNKDHSGGRSKHTRFSNFNALVPAWSVTSVMKYSCAALATYYGFKHLTKETPVEITVQEMLSDYFVKGYVERIYIVNRSSCRVVLKHDAPESIAGKVLQFEIGSPEILEAKVDQAQKELCLTMEHHVPIHYLTEASVASTVLPHLPTLLVLGSLLIVGRQAARIATNLQIQNFRAGTTSSSSGSNSHWSASFGKSSAALKQSKSKVKFSDVAGLGQAKQEVVEFVDFLKDPKRYEHLGARVPKGGLLVGPPGTGKTLLAKAVAGEAGVPFFSMSGSDFVEMFSGVGPSRVRDLFRQARDQSPSIIFIDEIDAIGRKRGGASGFSGGASQERVNTLNQLLVEMDGFDSTSNIIVFAGTNRSELLDDALKRPGRFDRQIAVDKPDRFERAEIFKVHLRPVTLDKTLDIHSVAQRLAALTPGFVGADIANVCNEAAIYAARRHSGSVEMVDFERATERVIGGLEKGNGLMTDAEKRAVALHESGHAVAGWFLKHADPLLKVSIIPRSNGALGFAQYLPQEFSLYSKESILDKIAVTLAGRAAEELFVGRITTGATDDLHKVTKMAYSMVANYGMNSQVGPLSYGERGTSEQFFKPYSERTSQLIDQEVRNIVDEQYTRVKALLLESKTLVGTMADALVAKETLVLADLQDLLGERPWVLGSAEALHGSHGPNGFVSTGAVTETV